MFVSILSARSTLQKAISKSTVRTVIALAKRKQGQSYAFEPSTTFLYLVLLQWWDRAIFLWPWNKNARTIQKQQTNRNRAIWLVYRTHTNAGGFWLVKRTLGWKNFMPENFLETNPYFALTSYCNTIGQSNNAYSILGFSLAGKRKGHVLIFSSIGW